MYTVKFHCPNKIIANGLAILAESGELQKLINESLERQELLEENKLDGYASPEYDDSEYPDHEVTLELE